MYVLKGFVVIQQLVNNLAGNVSLLGELSPVSNTFSKEIAYYEVPEIPGFKLNVFSNKNINQTDVFTDITIAQEAIKVVKTVFDYFRIHGSLVDLEDLRETIISSNPTVSNPVFGEFVNTPIVTLPEWITWRSAFKDGYSLKIWLSDTAFRSQYDEYSITVIPPLTVIDDFFDPPSVIKQTLDNKTVTDYLTLIQEARKDRPETILRSFNAKYYSNTVDQIVIDTNWTLLIYGNAGDNIEVIKQALIDYILMNTSFNVDNWKQIFPDIFRTNKLHFIPVWDKVAVNNVTNLSSIYSSIIDPKEVLEKIPVIIPDVSTNALGNTNIIPIPYRSIVSAIVPGNDNEPEYSSFKTLYPDYIPVNSTSLDFNRMSKTTTDFILKLERMIILAENLTEFASVPSEFRKFKLSNRTYIGFFDGTVNYLVLTRLSFPG